MDQSLVVDRGARCAMLAFRILQSNPKVAVSFEDRREMGKARKDWQSGMACSRGSPGPPGSVLRRFRRLEKVGEGRGRSEKVREGS